MSAAKRQQTAKTVRIRRVRHRDWYKYHVDVGKDGKKPCAAWVTATKHDAIAVARREGRRMFYGTAVFNRICIVVKRAVDGEEVFYWSRTRERKEP